MQGPTHIWHKYSGTTFGTSIAESKPLQHQNAFERQYVHFRPRMERYFAWHMMDLRGVEQTCRRMFLSQKCSGRVKNVG